VPSLIRYPLKSFCRRYSRNVKAFRQALQDIIEERRAGYSKSSFDDDSDLLGILLSLDSYQGDDERIKDELIIFFLAGNETIRASSANTVCYVSQNPEIKAKYLAEITPVLNEFSDNFVENLSMESVEQFVYAKSCWHESMRMQSPTPNSVSSCFSKTVRI